MALEDAVILADVVSRNDDIESAFRTYTEARYLRTARVQFTSRQFGELYHATGVNRDLRNSILSRRTSRRSPLRHAGLALRRQRVSLMLYQTSAESSRRVLIVEIVLAPGRPIGHPHRLIDLEMMVTLGGKERSEQEFADLLAQAGLRLTAVTPIAGSFFSVVDALAG